MRKKLLQGMAVVCMIFLISSTVAFCQTTPKEFKNKVLDIAVFQGGYGKDYWDAVIEKFEAAYPGVKVNMTISPKIGDIIRPRIVAGNPPDFLSVSDNGSGAAGVVTALIKEKGLLNITDVFNQKALDKNVPLKEVIVPGLLKSVKFAPYGNGKIYLAPFNIGPMGLIYNKNLFDKKGWAIPKTWDEFIAMGQTAQKDGRSLFTYQGIYPGYMESMLFPMIAAAGGNLDKIFNYEKGSFKNAAVKKVLTAIADISKKGYLMKGTVALNHTQSQGEMMMGKALFIPNGTWMEGEMEDAPREDGFSFGMIAPPAIKVGSKPYVAVSYEQFSIPAKAKNPELAKEFLKFLYMDESVKLFGQKANGVMAVKDGRELVKSYISESNYNFYGVLDYSIPIILNWKVLPAGSKVNINQEIFDKCVTAVMNGDMTVDQWMDNVEKAFTQARSEISKAK